MSGGVKGAELATLTFMVGARDAEFQAIKPILECMGKNIVHTGEQGLGLVSFSLIEI